LKLLAIETATDACSCALVLGEEREQRFEVAPRRHSGLVLGMASELLDRAGMSLSALDAIAFGRGPGSFTGVRIATAVAQGLGLAADLPLVPVSSLAALALAAARRGGGGAVLAAFDARMDEVYWGAFDTRDPAAALPDGEERVVPPACVPLPARGGWLGAGEGWSVHGDVLLTRLQGLVDAVDAQARPGAMEVAALAVGELRAGRACAPQLARPVYLRDRVTRKSEAKAGAVPPSQPS